MYKITPLIIYLFFAVTLSAQTKVVGECSVLFNIEQLQAGSWQSLGQKKVQIKGSQCKTVLTSPKLQQTLIFNLQQDSALILKDIGGSHFLQQILFPPNNQPSLVSMKPVLLDSASNSSMLGYACKRIQVDFSDGAIYDIIYTPEIIPTVPYFELAFKEVPGLVLSYTITSKNGAIVRYTASQVDLSPITLSQFEVNTANYEVID